MWQFADLWFAGPKIYFAICRYVIWGGGGRSRIFYRLGQTNQQPTFRLFCYKGREKHKMFQSLCLMLENLRICNLPTAHLRNLRICNVRFYQNKFGDLKFLNSHISEICGFLIANWAQEFADLRFADLKNICTPTFENLPPLSTILAANLPSVSATQVAYFPRINITSGKLATSVNGAVNISANFWQNSKQSLWDTQGLGGTDSWKILKLKISWHCPFKLPFACTNWNSKIESTDSCYHSYPTGSYTIFRDCEST